MDESTAAILGLVIGLALGAVFGFVGGSMSKSKGHGFGLGFVLAFCLGFIGLIIIACMSDRRRPMLLRRSRSRVGPGGRPMTGFARRPRFARPGR
jgi:hypothetical protein